MSLNELIAKRGQVKGTLTRFSSFFSKYGDSKLTELKTRLENLEASFNEFNNIQSKIELACNGNETKIKEAEEDRERYENDFFEIVAKAKDVIAKARNTTSAITNNAPDNDSVNLGIQGHAKLPALGLPKFNGEYDKWTQFADTFRTLVDENRSLDDIQKFYYLLDAVQGDAKRVLEAFEVTRDNYTVAWKLLKDRFENKPVIIHTHLKGLIDLQPVTKESNYQLLRKLLDNLEKHMRALKALGEPVETWDRIIIFLMVRKLDPDTKKDWEERTITTFNGNPKFSDFTNFLVNKCRILETIEPTNKLFKSNRIKQHDKLVSNAAILVNGKCYYCKGSHYIYRCFKWLGLSVGDRAKEVKRLKLCNNCLRSNHLANECHADGCKKCHGKHNTALHEDAVVGNAYIKSEDFSRPGTSGMSRKVDEQLTYQAAQNEDMNIVATATHKIVSKQILLPTAVILITDDKHNFIHCRALLDSGSQINFISLKLAQCLKLPVTKVSTPISGINETGINASKRVHATIKSVHNNFRAELAFLVLPNITTNLPAKSVDISNLNIPSHLKLADPEFSNSSEVDVLLGAGIFFDLMCAGQIRIANSKLVFQKTLLGWLVSGEIASSSEGYTSRGVSYHATTNETEILRRQLESFWKIEEYTPKRFYTKEERECEEVFQTTVKRDQSGRFTVTLPLKSNITDLGSSLDQAKERFLSLENKLRNNPVLGKKYTDFMTEYISLGHMSELKHVSDDASSSEIVYYMPHHGVLNEQSATTKLRVVFDASAKTETGIALNDALKVGPNVQDDLFSILLRFRKHKVGLTADIAKMYRQIKVIPEQQNLQRVLWRPSNESDIKHYKLHTVTYGTASASFLATRCLKQIALDIERDRPKVSSIILSDFYVDDLLTGADNEDEAIQIANEISAVLKEYGFDLRKWSSNKRAVLDSLGSEEVENVGYYIADDDKRKTLGVMWQANGDVFGNLVHTQVSNRGVTKRQILSVIAKLFDPLGLLGPVIIGAKILLQSLWKLKLGWDEAVPLQVYTAWNEFNSQLVKLNTIKVPRQAILGNAIEVSLHGFCDASERAYGACLYLRSTDGLGNVCVRLLCAKSRVAPLKCISLPRLELCGAVLLTRLAKTAEAALKLKLHSANFWSDSTITLAWIAAEPSSWKAFVANRVSEIQNSTNSDQWRHVASEENPADLISRGINPEPFIECQMWWSGPSWLVLPPENWPTESAERSICSDPPEQKHVNLALTTVKADESLFNKYSSLYKLTRIVAWCIRFRKNSSGNRTSVRRGNLSHDEVEHALHSLIKLAQAQQFPEEMRDLANEKLINKRSQIKALNPFISSDGLLRVGGRIRNADIGFSAKFPIILPQGHPLTKLIVTDQHHKQLHAGPLAILANLRERYWPVNGRNTIRSVLAKCVTCFRVSPKAMIQKMGDLPHDRLVPSRPFSVCGLDYAGPFNIKDGKVRNRAIIKAYMCLFICFSTKAIHIELVGDLTTNSFLNCLKRFVSRRGLCSKIFSDNATNFTGANNELKRIYELNAKAVKEGEIYHYFVKTKIDWAFIPPRSPHQGGIWEAAIKRAKYHVTRVVGNTLLTYEELSTVLTQVEAILNSRPLTPLSNDPTDLLPLTPGHFLVGDSLDTFPQRNVSDIATNRLDKYQLLQQMWQKFWKRWSREYLQSLQERRKWRQEINNPLKVGSMVVLVDDCTAPLQWKLGRITQLHPGRDGITRVITARTSAGEVKRAVQRVCVLPTE